MIVPYEINRKREICIQIYIAKLKVNWNVFLKQPELIGNGYIRLMVDAHFVNQQLSKRTLKYDTAQNTELITIQLILKRLRLHDL